MAISVRDRITVLPAFVLSPAILSGGYAQFYHFNYWGPIAPQQDTHVLIKMDRWFLIISDPISMVFISTNVWDATLAPLRAKILDGSLRCRSHVVEQCRDQANTGYPSKWKIRRFTRRLAKEGDEIELRCRKTKGIQGIFHNPNMPQQ